MRQGTRFLIGPLVGVVAVATLTGCGSSGTDADPVLGPPTTEVTATTEARRASDDDGTVHHGTVHHGRRGHR